MTDVTTSSEMAIFDDITELAKCALAASSSIDGSISDPKVVSTALFRRLIGHHVGFEVLWKQGLQLEADIILRSGIEAAICLAANAKLPELFSQLLRSDAAYTLQSQIKMYRNDNDMEAVRQAESVLRDLQNDQKAAALNWRALATQGDVARFYDWYKNLSGVSSHVSGVSIMKDIQNRKVADAQELLRQHGQKMHYMMMGIATLRGSIFHARTINEPELLERSAAIAERLDKVSFDWLA
jgi:hypothetical protein